MALYDSIACLPHRRVIDDGQRASLDASVLVVHRDAMQSIGAGRHILPTLPLREALGVEIANWPAFPFADSPSAARLPCFSGTLLAGRFVLTALHLRRRSAPANLLRDWRFLLGYVESSEGELPSSWVEGQNMFAASEVVTGDVNDPTDDWALFSLRDCGALANRPQRHLASAAPNPGDLVYLAGAPYGLGGCVSGPASVRAVGDAEFEVALPAFRGPVWRGPVRFQKSRAGGHPASGRSRPAAD